MRKNTRRKIDETSKFDHYIKTIKDVSVISSLVTGLGLLMLYFWGIAIFSLMYVAYGIYPFDFSSFRASLVHGCIWFSNILVTFPLYLCCGIKYYLKDAPLLFRILFVLPLVFIFAIKLISTRRKWIARRLLSWVVMFTLVYMFFYLVIAYLAAYATMPGQKLLLDPAVNVILQHKAELEKGANLSKFGINHIDTDTLNMIIKDDIWKATRIGTMLLNGLASVLYAIIIIALSGKIISKTDLIPQPVRGYLVFLRKTLIGTFMFFLCGFVFVFAGKYSLVNYSEILQKVDVSLRDRKDITSQYYAILFCEYDNDYVLYFPNLQNVIRVPKNKVECMLYKGRASIFADRSDFKKGSWLGLRVEWATSGDKKNGFKVNETLINSPAYKVNILKNDIITNIDQISIDGSRELSEIEGCIPSGKSVQLTIRRGNSVIKKFLTVENRP